MGNRVLIPIVASALMFAACVPAPAPDTTEADASAIRINVEKFVAAWNVGDSATIAPLLAENIILMQPVGPPTVGRDAVLENMAKGYDITVAQQTATVDEVAVMGAHAYAFGTWNVDPKADAVAAPQPSNGKWFGLYKRGTDGAWQLSRWIWNEDGPEQTAGG